MDVTNTSVCRSCWNKRNPDSKLPGSLKDGQGAEEKCVDCGKTHKSGIYLEAPVKEGG